jgi:hypothetical protein
MSVALKQPYPRPDTGDLFEVTPGSGILGWFNPATGESSVPGYTGSQPAAPVAQQTAAQKTAATQKSILKVVAVVGGAALVVALLASRKKGAKS